MDVDLVYPLTIQQLILNPKNGPKSCQKNCRWMSLRVKIDETDRKLIELINERAGYVVDVGKIKRANGISHLRTSPRSRGSVEDPKLQPRADCQSND